MTTTTARSPLDDVPAERGFRFQHGPVALNLREFRTALAQAPASVAFYHREHYAPWLREVVGDLPLARRIEAYVADPPAPEVYRELLVDLVARRCAELAPT